MSSAVLAGGLVATASVSASAAPAPQATAARAGSAAAATCPAQGHRIKVASDPTVYLIGPSNVMYQFEDTVEYFALYSSYNGIVTVSDSVFYACLDQQPDDGPWPLPYTGLEKLNGTAKVYIYDAYHGGDRWITSMSVFNRYGFDASKIEGTPGISRAGANWS